MGRMESIIVKYLCPDLYVKSILDVDLDLLKTRGYNTLLFDLDNTLLGWRAKEIPEKVLSWLRRATALGFKMCIISNSLVRRVTRFSKSLGIPAIPKAVKPMKGPFLRALSLLSSEPAKAVVIGDQVFTDVLGGKRLGMLSILVLPVDKREFFTTVFFRIAEKVVLFRLRRHGMLKQHLT